MQHATAPLIQLLVHVQCAAGGRWRRPRLPLIRWPVHGFTALPLAEMLQEAVEKAKAEAAKEAAEEGGEEGAEGENSN